MLVNPLKPELLASVLTFFQPSMQLMYSNFSEFWRGINWDKSWYKKLFFSALQSVESCWIVTVSERASVIISVTSSVLKGSNWQIQILAVSLVASNLIQERKKIISLSYSEISQIEIFSRFQNVGGSDTNTLSLAASEASGASCLCWLCCDPV